ncbi:monocarboxylate transporter 9-like [Mya arenaria]|uniref:monocarboxylate transporter 9-like n=1 Tax=Mya arenaria TaxID=6604 RepID=UPI0022E5F68C|nr:monocarboxylate transporter 9-like [Mya arenaria]
MTSRTHDIDDGWAWVVLAAVYSGQLLLSTAMYTAGVLYVEMLDYYQDDATKTSIIGSLNSGLLCLLGPLVSICINKLSCRVTIFTGGVCLMLAYLSSAFVSNINLLILSIGVLGGIGNALSSVPFTVVLVYYFERRRNIVLILSQAVIGIAMFLASPLALWLLDEYGLKGTFLIIAGFCAHLCVCAVICKPSVKEAKYKQYKYVFVAAIGLLTGLPNSLATPLTLTLVGVENISIAHGLVYFFCGIGFVSGPPLAALLLEGTGSYENSFFMSGAVLLFGSLMAVAAKIRLRKAQKERKKTNDESSGEEITTLFEKNQQ